jgi:GTPase SAR1 family protein
MGLMVRLYAMNALMCQDPVSFGNVDSWIKESISHSSDLCIRFLAGNKSDLYDQRKVTTEEATAKSQECNYILLNPIKFQKST